MRVVYLDAAHSPHAIRYNAQAGDVKNLHSNSLGNAPLPPKGEKELKEVLPKLVDLSVTKR